MKAVYIHVPFCNNICTYCDFCKIYYDNKIINPYLDKLKKEIVDNYQGELISTLYIGGGTPSSLYIEELRVLLEITKCFNIDKDLEFTIECNPENMDMDKLRLFKKYNVNRLSIGVQSFNGTHLVNLGRMHSGDDAKRLIDDALS